MALQTSIPNNIKNVEGNGLSVFLQADNLIYVKDSRGSTQLLSDFFSGVIAWGNIGGTLSNQTDLQTALDLKANLASPTFTGTVSGITQTMVGLGNVDNTSDANKPVSTATQTALNLKANIESPTFTGTVSGITKAMVGLGNVDNTSDADKPVSTATQTALDLKIPYTGATANTDLGNFQLKTDQLEFSQTPVGTFGVGKVRWNDTDGTTERMLKGGVVILQDGQEVVKRVVNKTGADLLESGYKVVRLRNVSEGGSQGQRSAVVLAQANSSINSTSLVGVVTETIGNNLEGFVTLIGEVRNIDTTGTLQGEAWVDGDDLFLSASVAGNLTNIIPASPNYRIPIATVDYAHATNGKISVHLEDRLALDTSLSNGNTSAPSVAAVKSYADSKVEDAIVDGVTDKAPSQNAVFDALALKAPLESPTFTGTVSGITQTMVGLGNVDNTSDANKPVSTATQTALDLKANLASPTFTGAVQAGSFVKTGGDSGQRLLANGSTEIRPTVYKALLSQSGTSAPTANVLDNSLGSTVTWARSSAGTYSASITGGFPATRTTVLVTMGDTITAYGAHQAHLSGSVISLTTKNSSLTIADLEFTNLTIQIEIYPAP